MMSPYLLMRALETQISGVLSGVDDFELPPSQQKVVSNLRRLLTDARLDIRDYELSETREEQLKNQRAAKKRLESIRKHILNISEFGVFGAADVAQNTAQIEQIIDYIR